MSQTRSKRIIGKIEPRRKGAGGTLGQAPDVMSIQEACKILGISVVTGRRWKRSGKLKAFNMGSELGRVRVHKEEVRRLLQV